MLGEATMATRHGIAGTSNAKKAGEGGIEKCDDSENYNQRGLEPQLAPSKVASILLGGAGSANSNRAWELLTAALGETDESCILGARTAT